MKPSLLRYSILGILSLFCTSALHAAVAYSLTDGGTRLVSFDTSSPGLVTSIGTISGGGVGSLLGIDFRPADGLLYGYSNLNTIVTVNLSNASTTLVSTASPTSSSPFLGIDFNPAADRLRLVNAADQNLRYVVGTGIATTDGALTYAAGDPSFGIDPNIAEVAYTNNDNNPITGTTIYYIDFALDRLATSTNPNGGVVTTVAGPGLGFNADATTGFDILTDGAGVNTAYASSGGLLYLINLLTGTATPSGAIGASGLSGLAVIPEPSSMLLVAAGASAFLGRRRRAC